MADLVIMNRVATVTPFAAEGTYGPSYGPPNGPIAVWFRQAKDWSPEERGKSVYGTVRVNAADGPWPTQSKVTLADDPFEYTVISCDDRTVADPDIPSFWKIELQ